jgi:hypothetical protein
MSRCKRFEAFLWPRISKELDERYRLSTRSATITNPVDPRQVVIMDKHHVAVRGTLCSPVRKA